MKQFLTSHLAQIASTTRTTAVDSLRASYASYDAAPLP
jgi:hypothetical protein